jgi:hypothetical protein
MLAVRLQGWGRVSLSALIIPVPDLGQRVQVVDIDGSPFGAFGVVTELVEQGVAARAPSGWIGFFFWSLGYARRLDVHPPSLFVASSPELVLEDYRGPIPSVKADDGTLWSAHHGWLSVSETSDDRPDDLV